MKKVAIVLNSSWYGYNFRYSLGLKLKEQGYKVYFIAPYDKYSELLKKDFEFYSIGIDQKGKNIFNDLKTVIEFYKLYKKLGLDIVLQYTIKPNIYGSLAARLLGINVVNNIAGLGTMFITNSIMTKVITILYKISQRKVQHVFFQNNDDHKLFVENNIVRRNKTSVLPGSGVDVAKFKPEKYNSKDTTVFLLASRMLWTKGVGEFVKAAELIKAKYSNVKFYLIGFLDVNSPTSITKEQMNKWEASGVVEYLGISDQMEKEISKADCVVLPSYYREGVPKILLESASMEKPIITTNNIGCKEVVDHGINGYLCEIKNAYDLSEKMEQFINLSNEERLMMGKQGRKKMLLEFDEQIVLNAYIDVVKKLND